MVNVYPSTEGEMSDVVMWRWCAITSLRRSYWQQQKILLATGVDENPCVSFLMCVDFSQSIIKALNPAQFSYIPKELFHKQSSRAEHL